MNASLVIAGLGGLTTLGIGIRMMTRPQTYIGQGNPPATDPRTIIWFGRIFTILGGAAVLLILFSILPE